MGGGPRRRTNGMFEDGEGNTRSVGNTETEAREKARRAKEWESDKFTNGRRHRSLVYFQEHEIPTLQDRRRNKHLTEQDRQVLNGLMEKFCDLLQVGKYRPQNLDRLETLQTEMERMVEKRPRERTQE